MRYIKYHNLKLAPEARWLGHSFRSLEGKEMMLVRQHYPRDYEKIRAWFPFVDAAIKQYELKQVEQE